MRTLLHRLFSQAKTKGCQSRVDIGVKYADKQQRMFDDEKMKAGQCVIGLQVQFSVSVISQDWCSQSETRGQGFKGNADKGLNLILFFFFFFFWNIKIKKLEIRIYFILFYFFKWSDHSGCVLTGGLRARKAELTAASGETVVKEGFVMMISCWVAFFCARAAHCHWCFKPPYFSFLPPPLPGRVSSKHKHFSSNEEMPRL